MHVVLNGTTLVMHNNYLILFPRKMTHKNKDSISIGCIDCAAIDEQRLSRRCHSHCINHEIESKVYWMGCTGSYTIIKVISLMYSFCFCMFFSHWLVTSMYTKGMIYRNRIFDHNATRESWTLIVVNEKQGFFLLNRKKCFSIPNSHAFHINI